MRMRRAFASALHPLASSGASRDLALSTPLGSNEQAQTYTVRRQVARAATEAQERFPAALQSEHTAVPAARWMIGKSRTCAVLALAQLTGAVATMKLRSGLKMSASGGAKGLRMPQPATLATSAALVSTGAVFVRSKMTQTAVTAVANPKMAEGLAYSFAALCGNTAASLLRKQVSRSSKVKPAEQVGLATALQGIVACAYCAQQGLFSTAVTSAFLVPAVGSAVLNALTKTLETKAYAITDVSLCAPFLAFDPVMQFLLPVPTQSRK